MITKIYEFHKMLNERAYNIDDTTNCVLISSYKNSEMILCLYDFVDERIIGYITAFKDKRYNYYIIDRATADKGWGPFMYSLMFYTVYPLSVKPSKLIRPAALNIWRQFLNNPEVKTSALSNSDVNYTDTWQPDVEVVQRDAPEETKIINTLYSIPIPNWYAPFVLESDKKIIEHNIDKKFILKNALNVWQYNYDSTRAVVAEGIGKAIKK